MTTSRNWLHLYPQLKEPLTFEPIADYPDRIQVIIPRTSWLERVAIRYLQQPDKRTIQLDPLGSFVLKRCDGHQSVQKIEHLLDHSFGTMAEPTLPRLLAFLQMIEAYGWIDLMSPSREDST